MLYPRNADLQPDPALFRDPPAEYRGTPFWAWNCAPEDGLFYREIDCMKQMGMGGFHMHVRVGQPVRYLSDEFMARIRSCVDRAREKGMLAWLYDEDKWPSGFAGGYVTEKEENRQKYLLLTPFTEEERRAAGRPAGGRLLARYDVELDGDGSLKRYRRLREGETAGGRLWSAWLQTTAPTAWFHYRGYADTMSPAAVRDFIAVTHEKYLEAVGDEFGKTVPAIFTDEPQMTRKTELHRSSDLQDIVLSWTGDFDDTYRAAWGESLLDRLPEVIWEMPEGISPVRWRYHDHSAERFASAYSDQIGAWCRAHGLLMTGHMMDEASLYSQTRAVGECMRSYRSFTLPGVDMLCDGREFTTVKQSASSAHQQGCPGVLSELYGVTNWDFDFRGHKLQGDWQAALGVSVRVPHLYWASMHGESKRDYPASIGHQSCWYPEYAYLEDHFARVNTLMTRGRPRVRVGVIHPIESYWIRFGPGDRTGLRRAELDRRFSELTRKLLENTVDFDFICESTLPRLHRPGGDRFTVGEMAYELVIVPACETLRSTTVEALRAYRRAGGRVLFLGDAPEYTDALPSPEGAALAGECERVPWDYFRLLQALEPLRDVAVTRENGEPAQGILYGLREDGEARNLFLCHAQPCDRRRVPEEERLTVTLAGCWQAEVWNTLTGERETARAALRNGRTVLEWRCWPEDSLLLRLTPAEKGEKDTAPSEHGASGSYGIRMSEEFVPADESALQPLTPDPVPCTPEEPNVCLLDTAAWRVDGGPWQEEDEMLRIGLKVRERLGLSADPVNGAQPWILPQEKPAHTLSVLCRFRSEADLPALTLALEDAECSELLLDGRPVPVRPDGCFVDSALSRVPLGPVSAGEHTLEITKPFGAASAAENCFLLGDFGVTVRGRDIRITAPARELAVGDWTAQGFPFYGGKMTYHFEIAGGRRTLLQLGLFAAPCVTAALDGKKLGNLSLAPHRADLGELSPGPHALDITVWPSRINTFGTFHLNDYSVIWYGPNAWRSGGMRRTLQYRLAPTGLLSEPFLLYPGEKR